MRNQPYGHQGHEDNDKDVPGGHKGLNDEGACDFGDEEDTGCEKSVGFHSCADSNGAWNVFDLDVRMHREGTTMLESGADYHRTCSWLEWMPLVEGYRHY